MGPAIQVGERLEAKMEALTYKANGIFAQELEEVLMKFTAKEDCKVEPDLVGQTENVSRNADVEVNITECTKSGLNELVEAECMDETQSSSSFDGCDSGVENLDSLDDAEVLSDFHPNAASTMDFDGFGEMFRMRKKRMTSHWRSFIHPLMWRCKWVELQIKKFEKQAQKYDRKLEEYSQKRVELEKSMVEDVGVKSLPVSRNDARNDILRRKKRRNFEATLDLAEYMSHHNLFSYYENEKHFADGGFTGDELKNHGKSTPKVDIDDELWGNDEPLSHETGNIDNSLEQIMWKIECLHSRVGKLKIRVDSVISKNAGMFSCIGDSNLAISSDAMADSPQNTAAPTKVGDRIPVGTYIASQLISEYKMGDVIMPAVTIRGEVPDVKGNTNQIYSADAYKNGEDDVLIYNRRAKEDMNNFDEVVFQPIQQPLVLEGPGSGRTPPQVPAGLQDCGLGSTSPPVAAEADPPTSDQPPTKLRSISKLTAPAPRRRKRGRRRRAGR